MIRENMHIHSKYSWDSKLELDEIAKELIKNDIKYGTITDHVELDRENIKDVIKNLKIRNKEIDDLNQKYDGKVRLLKGVEISSPHLYEGEVEEISGLDLDMVMGSIHEMNKTAKDNEKRKETFIYYNKILKMIKKNQIDVVGHLDYINKHYIEDYSSTFQLNEIFTALKETNTILEINSSASRRSCYQFTFPSYDKLKLYRSRINTVVIGTDAHEISEISDNLQNAEHIARLLDLKPVIYIKRKQSRI